MEFESRLLTVSLLLALGCEGKPTATSPVVPEPAPAVGEPPPVAQPAPQAALARLPDSDEGGSAAAVGTLRVKDGCVFLERPDGPLVLATTNPKLR